MYSTHLINPSSPKGGRNNPQTVFAPVLKHANPRDKIAPGTFKFILSPLVLEKKNDPTTFPLGRVSFQSWKVKGVGTIPWF